MGGWGILRNTQMRSGSGMLPSHGVSGNGANLVRGGTGPEAALRLFKKNPAQSKIATLGLHALTVTLSYYIR